MTAIPNYLSLIGDEHSGVELDCHECAIAANGNYFPIAYFGGRGQDDANSLPYFAYEAAELRARADGVSTEWPVRPLPVAAVA